MDKNKSHFLRTAGFALVLFVCLGLSLANATLSSVGLAQNSGLLLSFACVVAVLVAGAGRIMLVLVAIGVGIINLPEATLMQWGMDQELVLALVCAAILLPAAYNLLSE